MKKSIILSMGILASIGSLSAQTSQPATQPISQPSTQPTTFELQTKIDDALDFMRSIYDASYGPVEWKKSQYGWSLDDQIQKAKDTVNGKGRLTQTEVKTVFKNFIYSMKDYHTSIMFESTAAASLPFTIQYAGGKYLLAWIDHSKLSSLVFPFSVGDELVLFGKQTAAEAVAAVQAEIPEIVPETDFEIALLRLTNRSGARGYKVPKGPISLSFKTGDGSLGTVQLIWNKTEEQINPIADIDAEENLVGTKVLPGTKYLNRSLEVDTGLTADSQIESDNPYQLGNKAGFLPDLGHKIWEADASEPFRAYEFITPDRQIYGYIRIPSYSPGDTDEALTSFAKVVMKFQSDTDAIVIDQLHNPGGSVFYLYTLAALLSDKPLHTPLHKMTITSNEIPEQLSLIKALEPVVADTGTDLTARMTIGPSFGGYPVTKNLAIFFSEYAKFIVKEWNQGKRLTDPYWIAGINDINPIGIAYTKPILFLTDHLDFSGGDFMPAIMQDNQRVKLMGARTAGAGGYVNDISFPNLLGINRFRVTGSIAIRSSGQPIENLGVSPDIPYSITESDISMGYMDYARAIVQNLNFMARFK